MKFVIDSNVSKARRIDFYLIMYLFCVIFCPPFFPKYLAIFLLSIYTSVVVLKNYGKWKRNVNDNIRSTIYRLCFLTFYWLIISCIGLVIGELEYANAYFKIAYRFIMLVAVLGLFIPYIYLYCEKYNYTKRFLLKHIVYASCIQFLIIVIFVLIPSIRDLALSIMSKNTGSESLYAGLEISKRFYGFAMTLQDGFSYGVGIVAIIALYLAITDSVKYIIAYMMLTVVAAFNARTGLLIIAIGTIFIMVQRVNLRTIEITFIALIVGVIGIYVMQIFFPTTMQWAIGGFLQLRDFLLRRSYGDYGANVGNSVSALFSEGMWSFPSSIIENIIGTGHASSGADKTDVGYVNYIWALGIIGSIYLYYIFLKMYKKARGYSRDSVYKGLLRFVLLSMIIGNIKFDVLTYASGMVVILLLFTCDNKRKLANKQSNVQMT